MLSPLPGYLNIKNNRMMNFIKGVYVEKYSLKLIRLIHVCHTSIILSCMLKKNFQKPMCWILCFVSYSCQGGLILNKFELIHLHKNIKSTFTLSINVRLKVTRVFCILNSNDKDQVKEFY